MIINFKRFTGAISKMDRFAADTNAKKQILLDVKGDTLNIFYSDGRKNIVERIKCELEDGDADESAIVNVDNLKDVIAACAPSGSIKCDEITMKFDGRDKLSINADKYYLSSNKAGEEVKRVGSHVAKDVKYVKSEEMHGGSILTRFDYNTIFGIFAEDGVESDKWDIADMKNILTRVSKNDPKTCFISAKEQEAFSMTNASLTTLPLKNDIKFGFSLTSKVAKFVGDIFGSVEGASSVFVTSKENRYCYMMTDDETVGIMFENTPASRMDKITVTRYKEVKYETYSCIFPREVITDTFKTALGAGKDDNSELAFELAKTEFIGSSNDDDETELQCVITRGDGVSSLSGFRAAARAYESHNDEKPLEAEKLKINLKVLVDLLNNCSDLYVKIDMEVIQNQVYMKLTDYHRDPETGAYLVGAVHYTAASEA